MTTRNAARRPGSGERRAPVGLSAASFPSRVGRGTTPDAIGIRVPELPAPADAVLRRVGAVLATSANLAGGPDPARLEDVPPELLRGCAVAMDGGELPGIPSTVIDLTGDEPQVLREGAVPAVEALERVAGLVAE